MIARLGPFESLLAPLDQYAAAFRKLFVEPPNRDSPQITPGPFDDLRVESDSLISSEIAAHNEVKE